MKRFVICLLFLVFSFSFVLGYSIQYTDYHGFVPAGWTSVTLSVPQLNPSLYQDISNVDIYLDLENVSTGWAENGESTAVDINVGSITTLTADIPESASNRALSSTAASGLLNYNAGETKTFQDGGTNPPLTGNAIQDHWSYNIGSDATIINTYFVGSSTYDVITDAATGHTFNGDNNHPEITVDLHLVCQAKVTLTVIYTYDTNTPVTLSSFTAMLLNNECVSVNWITQSESGVSHYNLYRNGMLIHSQIAENNTYETLYSYDDNEIQDGETYEYLLESCDLDGTTEDLGSFEITVDFIEEDPQPELPQYSDLQGNFPNPFNPKTEIFFSIADGEVGHLSIYNVRGQEVFTKDYSAGDHQLNWEANQFESGVYFYKLSTPTYSKTKKMLLLK